MQQEEKSLGLNGIGVLRILIIHNFSRAASGTEASAQTRRKEDKPLVWI